MNALHERERRETEAETRESALFQQRGQVFILPSVFIIAAIYASRILREISPQHFPTHCGATPENWMILDQSWLIFCQPPQWY